MIVRSYSNKWHDYLLNDSNYLYIHLYTNNLLSNLNYNLELLVLQKA